MKKEYNNRNDEMDIDEFLKQFSSDPDDVQKISNSNTYNNSSRFNSTASASASTLQNNSKANPSQGRVSKFALHTGLPKESNSPPSAGNFTYASNEKKRFVQYLANLTIHSNAISNALGSERKPDNPGFDKAHLPQYLSIIASISKMINFSDQAEAREFFDFFNSEEQEAIVSQLYAITKLKQEHLQTIIMSHPKILDLFLISAPDRQNDFGTTEEEKKKHRRDEVEIFFNNLNEKEKMLVLSKLIDIAKQDLQHEERLIQPHPHIKDLFAAYDIQAIFNNFTKKDKTDTICTLLGACTPKLDVIKNIKENIYRRNELYRLAIKYYAYSHNKAMHATLPTFFKHSNLKIGVSDNDREKDLNPDNLTQTIERLHNAWKEAKPSSDTQNTEKAFLNTIKNLVLLKNGYDAKIQKEFVQSSNDFLEFINAYQKPSMIKYSVANYLIGGVRKLFDREVHIKKLAQNPNIPAQDVQDLSAAVNQVVKVLERMRVREFVPPPPGFENLRNNNAQLNREQDENTMREQSLKSPLQNVATQNNKQTSKLHVNNNFTNRQKPVKYNVFSVPIQQFDDWFAKQEPQSFQNFDNVKQVQKNTNNVQSVQGAQNTDSKTTTPTTSKFDPTIKRPNANISK